MPSVVVTLLPDSDTFPTTPIMLAVRLEEPLAVSDDALYSVGTNDFQFFGGDKYTMIKPNASAVNETFEPVRDILMEIARKAGTLVAPAVDDVVSR